MIEISKIFNNKIDFCWLKHHAHNIITSLESNALLLSASTFDLRKSIGPLF